MSDYPEREIDRIRSHLQEPDEYGVAEADAEVLLEMSNHIELLGPSKYSDQRHEFILKRCSMIARKVGGLADALEDRSAAEEIVRWINREQNNSPETNKDYRVTFRMFGELATDGEGKPESIEWVPGGYPSTYDPAPEPEKMFRWEEHIVPMLEACNNSRDRALIALAWDLGPRPSELFDLTANRFSDHKYGMKVTLYGGKRGTRSPVLVPSVPYVRQWLQDHPAGEGADEPLWTRLKRADGISNNRLRDILKEKAEAADMTPPSTPTPRRMRKSSASYLASEGCSQAHLEDHHGWDRGSSVAGRYIAVFGDAAEREIASIHGVDVEEDNSDPVGPIDCPRCSQQTPREKPDCVWCGQALSPQAAADIEAQQADAMESIREAHPEVADAIMTVEKYLGQDSGLRSLGADE